MSTAKNDAATNAPLANLEEWEDFLKVRYPENLVGPNANKTEDQFRDYENTARPTVREFYRLNHRYQSFDFVQEKRRDFLARNRREMSIWEAMEFLNTLVDDSDPDTDLSQMEHLLQTAEQIRKDGHGFHP
jgi:inositol oxygenase